MITSMKEAAAATPPATQPAAQPEPQPTPAPAASPTPEPTPAPAPAPVAEATTEVASTSTAAPAPATTTEATSTAVVPAPDRTIALPVGGRFEDEEAEGEFDDSDSIRATMVIVAKTGKMSSLFSPGDLVINKDVVIGGIKTPVKVVCVAMKKQYQNDLHTSLTKNGGSETVDSMQQVLEKNGVVQYRPNDDKTSRHYWKPILKTVLLIERPEGLSPAANAKFMLDINGTKYVMVGYTARAKSQYNRIAKVFIDTKKMTGKLRATTFQLSLKSEDWEAGDRSWIEPTTTAIGETPQVVLDFLKQYAG